MQVHQEDFTEDEELTPEEVLKKKAIKESFLDKIKNTIYQLYEPVTDPLKAPLHLTTKEIFNQIQSLYPSTYYNQDTIAEWLHDGGFTFYDYSGNLKFEWLIKKV